MRNQWVLVGILAGSLTAVPAFAQHKAPNQQPPTAGAPTAPTGDYAKDCVRALVENEIEKREQRSTQRHRRRPRVQRKDCVIKPVPITDKWIQIDEREN